MSLTKELRFSAKPRHWKRAAITRVIYPGYSGADALVNADVESSKQIRLQGQRLASRDNVQPNWGRVQDVASREYANAFQLADIVVDSINDWVDSFRYVVYSLQHCSFQSPQREVELDEELQDIISAFGNTSCQTLVRKIAQSPEGHNRLRLVKRWLSEAPSDAAPEASPSRATVLEQLEGRVEQIDGSMAFVSLKSEHGEEFYGEYPAEELLAKGIGERRRFRVETIEIDGKVRVSIDAIPDQPVPADEEDDINRRIDELLADDELDGDY
jgi:hypothetical protein